MPNRSNRNQSLATRLSSVPRVNLSDREPHQIVGTAEWALVKERIAVLEGRSSSILRDTSATKPAKKEEKDKGVSSKLIDRILNFIDNGEWAQIEGGEHDGKWVNPKYYPNLMFDTGRVKEEKTGEIFHFPVSSTEKDPKGIALHFETFAGGQSCTICPNIWQPYTTFKQRKRESRERRRREREINNIARESVVMEDNYD